LNSRWIYPQSARNSSLRLLRVPDSVLLPLMPGFPILLFSVPASVCRREGFTALVAFPSCDAEAFIYRMQRTRRRLVDSWW